MPRDGKTLTQDCQPGVPGPSTVPGTEVVLVKSPDVHQRVETDRALTSAGTLYGREK